MSDKTCVPRAPVRATTSRHLKITPKRSKSATRDRVRRNPTAFFNHARQRRGLSEFAQEVSAAIRKRRKEFCDGAIAAPPPLTRRYRILEDTGCTSSGSDESEF